MVFFLFRLEITLMKSKSNEPWLEVVKGDQRGIFRADSKDLLVFDEIINSKMVNIYDVHNSFNMVVNTYLVHKI